MSRHPMKHFIRHLKNSKTHHHRQQAGVVTLTEVMVASVMTAMVIGPHWDYALLAA